MTEGTTGMRVVPLGPESYPRWDAYLDESGGGTVYARSPWLRLMERAFGYAPAGFVAEEAGSIVGGLPLFRVPGLKGKRLSSSPFRDRGGAVCADEAVRGALFAAAVGAAREGRMPLAVKQAFGDADETARAAGMVGSRHWVTTRVPLSGGAEALWSSLKNNAQGPVKQARVKGVSVREGSGPADVAAFSRLFDANRRQLGIPTFGERFFRLMWEELGSAGLLRLLLAECEGRVAAGMIMLLDRDTAIDGYAASDPALRDLRGSDLLVWSAIEWAAGHGRAWFDFGADSPAQTGLLRFKKKWGGSHEELVHYHWPPDGVVAVQDSSAPGFGAARRVLSRLPMPLFKAVSALAAKRFG